MIIPYLPTQMIDKIKNRINQNKNNNLPKELLKPLNMNKETCDCDGCLEQCLYYGFNNSGQIVLNYEADISDVIGRETIIDIAMPMSQEEAKKLFVDLLFLYPHCTCR